MSDRLLQTKFHIPYPPTSHVPRPHLVARLNSDLLVDATFRRRLSLVSAPAGFGKTTLVAEWIRERLQAGAWQAAGTGDANRGRRRVPQVAWLSLDDQDNDLARFLQYLTAALHRADERVAGATLTANFSATLPSPTSLITDVLNDLAGSDTPIVLVLDDYHLVESAAIHDAMAFLLRHQPPRLHLAVASRGEPIDLPLASLRASQQMVMLDQGDLRFTPAETAAFLRSKQGFRLGESDLTALTERAEGWVTGLQLAALAAQRWASPSPAADSQRFLQALTGEQRYLADYLAEEVLAKLPATTQRFLEQTSILQRLCGPLCDAVTGEENGSQLLQHLYEEGLFLTPLDGQGYWYRTHHLFAAFLRHRLRRTQPELMLQAHRRASIWFQDNDLPHDAVRHALATGDAGYTVDVIDRYAGWLLRQGELTTLIRWVAPIPRAQLYARPGLGLALGWAFLIQGRVEEASGVADALEPHLGSAQQAERLALNAGIARRQERLAAARRFAREAVARRDERGDAGGSVALLFLAELMLGEGKLQEARRLANEARRFYRSQNQPYMESQALYYLINLRITRGELDEALALCREAFSLMDRHGLPYRVGGFHGRMGLIHWERHELDEAVSYLEEGLAIARRGEHVPLFVGNALCLARSWEAQGKGGEIAGLLEEAQAMAASSPQSLAQIRRWQAAAGLRARRTTEAARWVAEQELTPEDELDYYSAGDYLILARLLALQGEQAAARRLLGRLQSLAADVGACGLQLQSLLALADLYSTQGKAAVASRTVAHALALGSPGGYVQRFIEAGPHVAGLLRRLSDRHQQGTGAPFSRRYLARIVQAGNLDLATQLHPEASALQEALTPREREIVQWLGSGLSTPQIADELHISVGTVRWHVKNVYKKLSANNRVQAVRRAQALGLVSRGTNLP